MTDYEVRKLVAGWVSYYHDQRDDAKWQTWAAIREHLDYLVDYEPSNAWRVIAAIHARDKSVCINQSLCAGPLEELLARQGDRIIDTIAAFAQKNPSFATLLRDIWRGEMSDEVWAHIKAIRDRRVWRDNTA